MFFKKNGTTFSIENTQCLSTDVAPSHWAVSIEGCLPSCAGTPSVQETAGFFQVHRQDLRLQGLAVCPSRLFVSLFESSSYSISSSSPAGHLLFLFSGRLALRRRGPIAPSVTPSCHSLVGSDSRVIVFLKKSVLSS